MLYSRQHEHFDLNLTFNFVSLTVPDDLYIQESWKGPFIKDNRYEAKVEVFMGCSPQNVIIRRDNVQMGSDVIILNDQSAKVAKLTWDFNPVKSEDNGRTLTSHVEFTPYGSNTKKELFTENIDVEVFESKYQFHVTKNGTIFLQRKLT